MPNPPKEDLEHIEQTESDRLRDEVVRRMANTAPNKKVIVEDHNKTEKRLDK